MNRVQGRYLHAIARGVMVWMCRLKPVCALAALVVMAFLPAGSLDAAGRAEKMAGSGVSVRTFHGAWFDIRYPGEFTVTPSLSSSTAEGYDSAEFTSPDGTVSFYVYAPQWGGDATDIALAPEGEQLMDEQRLQKPDGEIRWFTIGARDGSYRRSYIETVSQQGTVKTVVGLRYRDEEARRRYLEEYLLFRQSLQQYAD